MLLLSLHLVDNVLVKMLEVHLVVVTLALHRTQLVLVLPLLRQQKLVVIRVGQITLDNGRPTAQD